MKDKGPAAPAGGDDARGAATVHGAWRRSVVVVRLDRLNDWIDRKKNTDE